MTFDHTSGVMRCEYRVLGGHVHCAVFGPFSGKAGDLIFRVEEWEHFQQTHPNWQFTERASLTGHHFALARDVWAAMHTAVGPVAYSFDVLHDPKDGGWMVFISDEASPTTTAKLRELLEGTNARLRR